MKIKYNREFLGTLITSENYSQILLEKGRDEINFHNKHLRAYKRGKEMFTHGIRINEQGDKLGPMFHKVQEKVS